ncbi:MAG TPA: thioesterase family protein [Solirubrobacteraceae bacterium]|jgi:acyl-CoA thioesterase
MGTSFDRDTAVRLREQHSASAASFATDISPEWRAGRGPHGGYLAAIVLRALSTAVDDPARTPRSLTVHYSSAPEPGPAVIHTTVERKGRSLSTLSARLEQDGVVMAIALAAFSIPWTAPDVDALPMPKLPPPDPERRFSPALFDGAPPFTRHLVMQPRVGATPFAGADSPMEIGGWIGLPEPRPVDALSLALFSDAWFPPSFIALSEPAVSPTVDLTVHFRQSPAEVEGDPGDLCLSLFRTRLLHEGFFEEDGVIWAPDGSVLAQSRQLGIIMPTDSPALSIPAGAA